MRNSKAKHLRRRAEAVTAGLPLVAYNEGNPPAYRGILGDLGTVISYRKIMSGTPRKMVGCTRLTYKHLKRAMGMWSYEHC